MDFMPVFLEIAFVSVGLALRGGVHLVPVILLVCVLEAVLIAIKPAWIHAITRTTSSHGLIYGTCVLPVIIQLSAYSTFISHSIVIAALSLTSLCFFHTTWSPRAFICALVIHALYPSAVTLTVICVTCCATLLYTFPRNFSLGEALLIANTFCTVIDSIRFVSSSDTVSILSFLFLGILVTAAFTAPILARLRVLSGIQNVSSYGLHPVAIHLSSLSNGNSFKVDPTSSTVPTDGVMKATPTAVNVSEMDRKSPSSEFRKMNLAIESRRGWTAAFYFSALFMVFGYITPIVISRFGLNPWLWVFHFVFSNPINVWLTAYWILLISISFLIFPKKRNLNLRRKYFHLLATACILPGYLIAPIYTCLAMDVSFVALILVEMIRVGKVPPFGDYFHSHLTVFCDQRDEGIVLTSHIYLLLGLASPIWVAALERKWVVGLSGMATLGIGDTFASIVGSSIGRFRWFKSSPKTIEGSIAFFLSSLLFYIILGEALSIKLLLAILLSAIVEAISTQFDNLFIPIIMIFMTL